jgi:hypothetical protein
MEFKLNFVPKPFEVTIKHTDNIFLIGSCFTENIGTKFRQHLFNVCENPNGILFNPISIAKSITSYIENKTCTADTLFFANEVWNSWEHHSRFSGVDKHTVLNDINVAQNNAHYFLKKADWVVITLGSAFVYQINNTVVANCHKIPTDKFNKKLLTVEEVLAALDNVMHRIFMFAPQAKIMFTISPVRHLRDGFIENNRSKAVLIQAVHHLVAKFNNLYYFPAYELVLDDLRDYRFFAEDMVHPNYLATNYVWEKLVQTCISAETQNTMQAINELNAAMAHKPFNPTSGAHAKFLEKYKQIAIAIQQKYGYLNLTEYINYFTQ